MKKALLVTRVSGFIPQFEMNNVRILQEMGYEIHYASNFNTVVYGMNNHRLRNTGIIKHQIDFERSPFSPSVMKSYKMLKELMEEYEFDLIHCHMPMSGVVTRMAAESLRRKTGRKVPVMYTAHGFHFYEGAPLLNWLYYPVERHLAKYTDCLVLINEEDYGRASHFKVRGKVEQTRGIGIHLDQYDHFQKKRWEVAAEDLRQEDKLSLHEYFQIPPDYEILISVGELTSRKNHRTMIEAMKELKDLAVAYVICGSGPLEHELRELVQELGLENRVKFAGYVENVPEFLHEADCFVFPSKQEGLPVAVMEAMAVGLPVIASRIRGITDLIEHTQGGYLVNGFAPEDYAVKVRRMFTKQESKSEVKRDRRREEMGLWNQRRIAEFSLPVVEKKMREIYGEITE